MRQIETEDGKLILLKDDGTWSEATGAGSTLDRLRGVSMPPAIVNAVRGLFGALGIRVVDTRETFTCTLRGDAVEFTAGVDESSVDFVVPVYQYQLARLAEYIGRGTLDELEQFRIVRALFATAAGRRHLLSNPLLSNPVLRRIIGGKNVLHVTLVSPDPPQEPDATFTIIFVNREQIAVPGLHGTPERRLRVHVPEAIELQRQIYAGMKANDLATWTKIARWYVDWRKRVEVATG
jgi:hypothetical protein